MDTVPIEASVYRDGRLITCIAYHQMGIDKGWTEALRLPQNTGNVWDDINVRIEWDGSPFAGWHAFRVALVSADGRPLAPPERPGLLYTAGPTDCPSVTVMQSNDPGSGSVYALALRRLDRHKPAPATLVDADALGRMTQ